MIPIHELLNRIRWDAEYGNDDFKLGFYDRVEDTIVVVPMKQVYFESDNHFSFGMIDSSAEYHMIPFHRIRQVYRNDELIWERPHYLPDGESVKAKAHNEY